MHPHLLQSLDACVTHFHGDPRCIGMYLHGSIGRGETDAYSDIDVCAVIDDEHYGTMKNEMPVLCQKLFGPIVIWLPEGEQPNYCNFAFLYEHGDELLLTDFDIISRSLFVQRNARPDRILWDRIGLLQQVADKEHPIANVTTHRLQHLIDTYWVYAYLDGKYWRRNDLYKLLYVQQTLGQLHMKLLNITHKATEGNWWAGDMIKLPTRDQKRMRTYFSAATPKAIGRSLAKSIDLFSDDAKKICSARNIPYPIQKESAVRKHLQAMGLPSKS